MRPLHRLALLLAGWLAAGAGLSAEAADVPRPLLAWPAGPFEVHIAFEPPLQAATAAKLVGRPIYFTLSKDIDPRNVVDPSKADFGKIRIAATRIDDGGQTLVLTTDPHPRESHYVLPLPEMLTGEGKDRALVVYGLYGVEATWDDGTAKAKPAWTGWWPRLDPDVARAQTNGSAEHERALGLLAKPGRLTLHTLVVLPKGHVSVRLAGGSLVEASLDYKPAKLKADPRTGQRAEFVVESTGEPLDLTLAAKTGVDGEPIRLRASYKAGTEPEKPLTHDRLILPWAPAAPPDPAPPQALPAELAGGDPKRGEAVFFGDQAKCSQCHKVGGKGNEVGPDLSDQWRRDRSEIYRDIFEPSAVINPDYVPYTIALKNGQVLAGIVRAEGADRIRVSDTEAKSTVVPRAEIEELRPSATSIMPVGLVGAIGEANMRDLLAFLSAQK
jgi:putative heme-binding domain-containing protein